MKPIYGAAAGLIWTMASLAPALIAYLAARAPDLSAKLLYTPWHPDDFDFLNPEFVTLSVWRARPVSTNVAHLLGSMGPSIYYTALVATWTAALVVTGLLCARIYRTTMGIHGFMLLAFCGSFIWYSQASSAASTQYLGLSTNILSYGFGIWAAYVCLGLSLIDTGSRYWSGFVAFALLSLLSAFSKEDMFPFLILICGYAGVITPRTAWNSLKTKIRFLSLLCVVGLSYSLSIWHAVTVGSPFILGTGPGRGTDAEQAAVAAAYSIAEWRRNVPTNAMFYVGGSTGLVVLFSVTLTLAGISTLIRNTTPRAREICVGTWLALGLSVALIAPYLILPRHFDFYAMNYVPILAFAILQPTFGSTKRFRVWHRASKRFPVWQRTRLGTTKTVIMVVALLTGLYMGDMVERNARLEWLRVAREMSARQIDEVRRAGDMGLRDCTRVAVYGVDGLGPFVGGKANANYLNRMLGKQMTWTIVTDPNTLLREFATSRPFAEAGWRYVKAEAYGSDAPSQTECSLRYDPETWRATFRRPVTLNSAAGYSLSAVRAPSTQ